MATTTTHPDRITRAIEILNARPKKIARFNYADGSHCWGCDSSDLTRVYRITDTTCNCPDFVGNARRGQAIICKHLWAGPGAPAAMLIHLLRDCSALWQLRQTGELYAAALANVPAGFVQTARDEYRLAVDRIVRRITFALEVAA